MTATKIISAFSLVFLLSGIIPAANASSRSDVDTDEKNYAPNAEDWNEYGNADVKGDGRIELTSTDSRSGYLYEDVSIPSRHEGDYAVFISFTRAEDPHGSLSNGGENIAGLPYLYAYDLDEDGGILEYVTDSTMRQSASAGSGWKVSYGIEQISDDTESMRLFLKQASRNGTRDDGRSAWFYDPGLFIVNDLGDASDVIDAYRDAVNDINDSFHVRYDSYPDYDYATGTLLKCYGEPEVYSVTSGDDLKLFPNEETFYAWGNDFDDVREISCSRLNDYDVVGTWTYSRASYLVQFYNQPGVYTLDNGEYLRLIPDEYTAKRMYGSDWVSLIDVYSQSDKDEFTFSAPHRTMR